MNFCLFSLKLILYFLYFLLQFIFLLYRTNHECTLPLPLNYCIYIPSVFVYSIVAILFIFIHWYIVGLFCISLNHNSYANIVATKAFNLLLHKHLRTQTLTHIHIYTNSYNYLNVAVNFYRLPRCYNIYLVNCKNLRHIIGEWAF